MKYTAGIFIFNEHNKLLICHASGARWNQWSIPKGIVEDNEQPIDAAIRETFEETGLKLTEKNDLIELPPIEYLSKKKTLIPFILRFRIHNIDTAKLICHGRLPNSHRPECDKYKLVSLTEADNYIHCTQAHCISQINVLKYLICY